MEDYKLYQFGERTILPIGGAISTDKDYVFSNGEKLRIEGKEYEMVDGDICHFRFNV